MGEGVAESGSKPSRVDRKVAILQAVMALLEEGERKVTTASLASRVGVSEAALYRHYKSKEAMIQALTDYLEDHLLRPANQLKTVGESALVQLGRLFEYHLRFFADHPGLCRLFLVEWLAAETTEVGPRMVAIVRKYQAQVKQILRRGQALGEIPRSVPVEDAAAFFVGIIQSRALNFVMSGFQASPLKEWGVAWGFYLRAIQAVGNGSAPPVSEGVAGG